MKLGLQIPNFTWPGGTSSIAPTLTRIAQTADEAGFASLWVMDHFFQIGYVGKPEEPMLEGYAALNFLAGKTSRVRLGTMVTGVVYRYPGLLVKTVTTLDVLSGGRAYLGIGAAWNEQEARGLGIPFPPLKERFEQLEDALQIAHQMWKGDESPFRGRHTAMERPLNSPNAISRPHPPILVGGGGEKKTLRLVAKYADACNLFARMGEEALRQKLDILRQHCDEVGRSYAEIEKTALSTFTGDVQEFIDHCGMLSRLGFAHVIVNIPNVQEIKPLEVLCKEVLPAIARI
jgi:F420-dependent oxidoreductase-like protein